MPPVVLDGKYELLEMAGEGGMASVWKAQVKGAAGSGRPGSPLPPSAPSW